MQLRSLLLPSIIALLCFGPGSVPAAVYPPVHTRAGTQTFAPKYGFTSDTRLVETAKAISDLGSDVIKLGMSYNAFGSSGYNLPTSPSTYPTLRSMAENEPSYKYVLDMGFSTYLFWCYPRSISGSEYHGYWRDGLSSAEATAEYSEIRELCEYLLNHYNGTGKTFLIGHWEGDWAIRGSYDPNQNPTGTAIQGMIDWLRNRQQAVTDARAAVPTSDVKVFCYAEVNLVNAWEQGWTKPWQLTVHKDVLPHVTIDMVSYSAYEVCTMLDPGLPFPGWMQQCLTAIESNTTFTAAAPYGKKVFIGEYGAPTSNVTPAQQGDLAMGTLKGAASWGCPFVLYWQMYDNEGIGYWMINSSNAKQPSYYKYQEYLGKLHTLKNLYRYWLGRNPSYTEISAFSSNADTYAASGQMNTILNSAEFQTARTNAQYLGLLFQTFYGTSSTSDPDYVSYLAQLGSGTPRATVLDSILNSTRFKSVQSAPVFVQKLYLGTLQRSSIDMAGSEAQAAISSLNSGTPRATMWRSFLDSIEFRDAELLMKTDNTAGSNAVASKYLFTPASAAAESTFGLYE